VYVVCACVSFILVYLLKLIVYGV